MRIQDPYKPIIVQWNVVGVFSSKMSIQNHQKLSSWRQVRTLIGEQLRVLEDRLKTEILPQASAVTWRCQFDAMIGFI